MALQAVNGVTAVTPVVSDDTDTSTQEKKDYKNMTAKEIIAADKSGETIPVDILQWAKENPDSKDTYSTTQGNEGQTEENDAIDYRASLEEQGMSLKEQCKQFTQLSAQKETRDLQNITKMAPYMQQVPTDDQSSGNATSAVQTALQEIVNEITKGAVAFFGTGNNKFKESQKFFSALKKGSSDEVNMIDDSLESIQDVLNGTISDAKDSKQYGEETTNVGREFKSSTKWWKFKNKRIAKKAIEQGENTVKMAERTNKLAQAIAKDNGAALNNSKNNIQTIEQSVVEEPKNSTNESAGAIAFSSNNQTRT